MSVDGRTGDVWNRWTNLSRDMVGGLESFIGCLVLIQSLCSIVPLEWSFFRRAFGGHGSNSILDTRV
jgi:hypothetical protein